MTVQCSKYYMFIREEKVIGKMWVFLDTASILIENFCAYQVISIRHKKLLLEYIPFQLTFLSCPQAKVYNTHFL